MQEKIINTPFHEKGHIIGEELQNDVSDFLLFNFRRNEDFDDFKKSRKSQKALRRKDYLLASSIATATATCHKNNLRLFHHGVVASGDETHHLCAVGEREGALFAERLRY